MANTATTSFNDILLNNPGNPVLENITEWRQYRRGDLTKSYPPLTPGVGSANPAPDLFRVVTSLNRYGDHLKPVTEEEFIERAQMERTMVTQAPRGGESWLIFDRQGHGIRIMPDQIAAMTSQVLSGLGITGISRSVAESALLGMFRSLYPQGYDIGSIISRVQQRLLENQTSLDNSVFGVAQNVQSGVRSLASAFGFM
jgi:hypothetical protein